MLPRHLSTLFAMLIFTCSLPAFAAETVLLDEIVVRATEVTTNEEVLTIREVRESPARDIGEAAGNIPGLTSLRKGAIANDIVLRGLQGDDINVLMDGVRIQGGCPSRMDPPAFHFDFAEVESIEVVKGPYDLTQAGSMGGLVNVVSKSADPGPGFSASFTVGSYEELSTSVTASMATEKADVLGGYAYKTSKPPKDGNGDRITEIYPATSRNRYREKDVDSDAYRINTYWMKAGLQLNNKTRTELNLAHQDAEHVLYPALYMDAEYDRTDRLNWTTTVDQPSGFLDEIKLQAYWTGVDHLMHDEFRESSRPNMMITRDYMMETDADTTTYGASLSGALAAGPGELRGGIDSFHKNWDAVNRSAMYMGYAPQPMIPDVDQDQIGLFAEYNWPATDTIKITTGLRLDYADTSANSLDSSRLDSLYQPYQTSNLSRDNDFFEPTANLQLNWQPEQSLELFAGLASASRMPDAQELYIGLQRIPTMMMPSATNWIGNPDLDPSRNNQVEVGIKFTGDTFFLSGSTYYSRVDDYINLVKVPDPDGPGMGTLPEAKTYRNVDAELYGGELSGQISLPLDMYLTGNLAYTHGENRDTNEPLAEIPPLAGSVALRYDIDTWFIEVQEQFADQQDRVDDTLNEEETSGWNITNIKAGMNLDQLSIYAGVNNLFDKYYFSHLSYQRDPFRTGAKVPETGSFAYLTVMYKY